MDRQVLRQFLLVFTYIVLHDATFRVLVWIVALLSVGLLTDPAAAGQNAPKSGGTPKIAWLGEPSTLDIPESITSTQRVVWHTFERLCSKPIVLGRSVSWQNQASSVWLIPPVLS
jgi:hypothetical protein